MPAAVVAAVVGTVSFHAMTIPHTYDIGLAYQGARVAWETGRPESLHTWISTPFLALLLAPITRVISEAGTADVLTLLNLLVLWGGIGAIWRKLRFRLPVVLWWITLLCAVGFAPAISSLWWKQLNLVAFALAIGAFGMIRRGRDVGAGVLVALSIAVKPIIVLLPLLLVLRRETRRSGLVAIAVGGGLLAISQAFLAIRAGEVSVASPLPALRNFSEKSLPQNIWVCHNENFSPQSTVCRLAGAQHWNVQRAVVVVATIFVVALVIDSMRGIDGRSWEWFAAASMLSPMVSPIAWSHYQLLLGPMLLVLAVRFWAAGESRTLWAWLIAGYLLTLLVWQPAGSAPGAIRRLLGGPVEDQSELFGVFAVAMFAQYVVLFTALLHFRGPLGPSTQVLPRSGAGGDIDELERALVW